MIPPLDPLVGATFNEYHLSDSETEMPRVEHEKLVFFLHNEWRQAIRNTNYQEVCLSQRESSELKEVKDKKNVTTLKEQIKNQENIGENPKLTRFYDFTRTDTYIYKLNEKITKKDSQEPFLIKNLTLKKIIKINSGVSHAIVNNDVEFKSNLIKLVKDNSLFALFSRLEKVVNNNNQAAPYINPIINQRDDINILILKFNKKTEQKLLTLSFKLLEKLRQSLINITTSVDTFIAKKVISDDLPKNKIYDNKPVVTQNVEPLVDCDIAIKELNLLILSASSILNKKLSSFSAKLIDFIQNESFNKLFMCLMRIKFKNKSKKEYINDILALKIENSSLSEINCNQNIKLEIVNNTKSAGVNELILIKNQFYIITSRLVTLLSNQSCIRHRDITFVSINSSVLNMKFTVPEKGALMQHTLNLDYTNEMLIELNSLPNISKQLKLKTEEILSNLCDIYTTIKDIATTSKLRVELIGELKLFQSSFETELTNVTVIKHAVINSSEDMMKSFINNAIKIMKEIDFVVN